MRLDRFLGSSGEWKRWGSKGEWGKLGRPCWWWQHAWYARWVLDGVRSWFGHRRPRHNRPQPRVQGLLVYQRAAVTSDEKSTCLSESMAFKQVFAFPFEPYETWGNVYSSGATVSLGEGQTCWSHCLQAATLVGAEGWVGRRCWRIVGIWER